jgi:DNA-binding transcriptional ArsR family regulator
MPLNIDSKHKFKAKVFAALADSARLEILEFLRDGEKCVCEITPHLGLIQPVVSRHLKVLKDSGLVRFRKDGNKRLYSINDSRVYTVIDDVTPEFVHALIKKLIAQLT